MSLTYNSSHAADLFRALVVEEVRADELQPGDLVCVDDWTIVRVASIQRLDVPWQRRSYPLWRDALCEICVVDADGGAQSGWPESMLVQRIPRAWLRPEPQEEPPARLQDHEAHLADILRRPQ